jgi:hypothetical protein
MARDLYSREVQYGGSFSADGARITFGDNFDCGLLVQNINWQYQQNITRLYEVGCPNIYLVGGRTQGQAGVNRVIGPKKLAAAFYTKFGDVCCAGKNFIRMSAITGCSSQQCGTSFQAGKQQILMSHCVLQTIGGSVDANNMIINEQLSLMFLWLQLLGAGGDQGVANQVIGAVGGVLQQGQQLLGDLAGGVQNNIVQLAGQ